MSTVGSVYRNVQNIRTAIKDVARLRQIAMILTRHGFGALVTQMRLAEVIGLRRAVDAPAADTDPLPLPRRLRVVFEELGPTFIKLGQILSTRSDLIRPDIIAELQRLQDDVPPMPFAAVRSQIEAALGQTVEEAFRELDEEPLASASVAQVHRAILPNGEEVVVKVQRAGIRPAVASDLNIMQFLAARAAQLVPELQIIDPVGIIEQFERALSKELDFSFERMNIEKFQVNFAGFDGIRVPAVFPEYCRSTLLTLELIQGVKVTEAPEVLGAETSRLASTMLRGLFKMLLSDGLFHGDLHPGNILVTPDHSIVLIDFGLVGRLLPRQRDMILELLIGISKEDYELVSRVFFDIGVKIPGVRYDYTAFENDVTEVMDRHLAGQTLENLEVKEFFSDLVGGAIKHQIKMPPTYTMVFKALVTVEGIGKTLSPKLNLIDEAGPILKDLIRDRYNPERLVRDAIETVGTASRSLRSISQATPRVLHDLELGRLSVKVEVAELNDAIEAIRRSTNRVIRALVFGASAVAGTLALEHAGPQVLGLPLIAFGAYVIAGVAGAPLIFSLLSRR